MDVPLFPDLSQNSVCYYKADILTDNFCLRERGKIMGHLFLVIVFVLAAVFVPRFMPTTKIGWLKNAVRAGAGVIALFLVFSTSYVIIDADKVGHLKRVYFGEAMPPGQIIAFAGQKGPQAEVLPPGFKFKLLLNILYDVEELPIVQVPEGNYGFAVASDGAPLRRG